MPETSALETLYGGYFTSLIQLIKTNYLLIPYIKAALQFLQKLTSLFTLYQSVCLQYY